MNLRLKRINRANNKTARSRGMFTDFSPLKISPGRFNEKKARPSGKDKSLFTRKESDSRIASAKKEKANTPAKLFIFVKNATNRLMKYFGERERRKMEKVNDKYFFHELGAYLPSYAFYAVGAGFIGRVLLSKYLIESGFMNASEIAPALTAGIGGLFVAAYLYKTFTLPIMEHINEKRRSEKNSQ